MTEIPNRTTTTDHREKKKKFQREFYGREKIVPEQFVAMEKERRKKKPEMSEGR